MTEDHLLVVADFAFFLGESAPKRRRDAQQPEPGRRDQHAANLLRRTIQLHSLIAWAEDGVALESGHFPKTVEVVAGTAVVDADDPGLRVLVGHDQNGIGVEYGQGTQDNGVYDGEESGVGGDADGKGEKDG